MEMQGGQSGFANPPSLASGLVPGSQSAEWYVHVG